MKRSQISKLKIQRRQPTRLANGWGEESGETVVGYGVADGNE
jgi:hypothetical protein